MGLITLLTTKGSNLSSHDGATPPTNALATKASPMHAKQDGTPGYSLNGTGAGVVTPLYASYEDGVPNSLPRPSILDIDGKTPGKYRNPETGTTYP
jgi:hypothetical protein